MRSISQNLWKIRIRCLFSVSRKLLVNWKKISVRGRLLIHGNEKVPRNWASLAQRKSRIRLHTIANLAQHHPKQISEPRNYPSRTGVKILMFDYADVWWGVQLCCEIAASKRGEVFLQLIPMRRTRLLARPTNEQNCSSLDCSDGRGSKAWTFAAKYSRIMKCKYFEMIHRTVLRETFFQLHRSCGKIFCFIRPNPHSHEFTHLCSIFYILRLTHSSVSASKMDFADQNELVSYS